MDISKLTPEQISALVASGVLTKEDIIGASTAKTAKPETPKYTYPDGYWRQPKKEGSKNIMYYAPDHKEGRKLPDMMLQRNEKGQIVINFYPVSVEIRENKVHVNMTMDLKNNNDRQLVNSFLDGTIKPRSQIDAIPDNKGTPFKTAEVPPQRPADSSGAVDTNNTGTSATVTQQDLATAQSLVKGGTFATIVDALKGMGKM